MEAPLLPDCEIDSRFPPGLFRFIRSAVVAVAVAVAVAVVVVDGGRLQLRLAAAAAGGATVADHRP